MILEYDNIKLRGFRDEDIPKMVLLANNRKVSMNLRDAFPHPYLLSNAQEFVSICNKQNPKTTFAIEWEGNYVGNIGLLQETDVYRKTAEIGYFIGEPFWNKGIASKAVNLITDFGFNVLKVARIHTGVFEYNTASMRVLEKNGYVKEGIFKKSIFKDGKLWDEHRYAKFVKY